MKTKINQIFGNVAEYDLQVYKLTLDLENSSEKEALEQGWLIFDNEWYNSRSVRIDEKKFLKQKKKIDGYTFTYVDKIEEYTDIIKVFETFVKVRNLKSIYSIDTDLERACWILVHKDENLVAFSKLINYNGGLETQFTAWNYSEPKTSLARHLLAYEIDVVRKKGLAHLYIGSGYGNIGIYKSAFGGFEWWTGSEWSQDIDKYTEICKRDDQIKTLEDLSGLINESTKGT
jgi:hypothetical protein